MSLPAGARLGPYEILDLVGAGGMGEVYRARDPRLGREVAIKVLPAEVASNADRLARFEREARAVAALSHPNILTVFDVGTHRPLAAAFAEADAADATVPAAMPYVVMELLQGETLREVASRRAPNQRQVLGFAVRIADGLAAAHAKGIVHRDIKPENVFVTTDGRVKVLDFGLAKLVDRQTSDSGDATEASPTGTGQVIGTVGYMSPEQVRGQAVDHRTDIFSFGVVLYELLCGQHPFRRGTTIATLSAILDDEPVDLASLDRGIPLALSGIVQTCLEKSREERFHSAHDLARSLEAVLAAPAGAASLQQVEEKGPYPGLSSYTEKDAEVFFGREAEVSALWEKIHQKRLLAVIGPSGAGKTSFLRAGVMPARPPGWAAVHATPGANPGLGLAHALTTELAGDPDAMRELIDGVTELAQAGGTDRVVSAVMRWRTRHAEALVVVDQLEELFTLSPPETQARFAVLLARLASDAGVHIVLSFRDDFLLPCFQQEPLAPSVTPLTVMLPLKRDALCRALVEPARRRGYGFEDDALVGEMVESVEGARSALPLLAFAAARLWEKRDRERKLLTRAAYGQIGGVAGSLAQHAETTMDHIGAERQGIVREIFRNLVTAHGTRAVVDRGELLSAFPQREQAEEVLRDLIDARLVTSYEVEGAEGQPGHHRVEVVHESLLSAWPRLVRWQVQDEEGALLRDQLKQAAHLWQEKGRGSDLLWTGTAYQEFELWRGRYTGTLTALEECFAQAMADRAQRQRRRRRLAVGATLASALLVAAVTGALWRRSETARERAKAEALRAEAGKLLAIARTEIDRYPTAALAYARQSLELFDTPEARRFTVEALWRGPVARVLPVARIAEQAGLEGRYEDLDISPDGRWLAMQSPDGRLLLFPHDGGALRSMPTPIEGQTFALRFGPRSDRLVANGPGQSLRFLSVPDLREVRRVTLGGFESTGWVTGDRLVTITRTAPNGSQWLLRTWPLGEGEPRNVARVGGAFALDAAERWIVVGRGRTLVRRSLGGSPASPERAVGELRDEVSQLRALNRADRLASLDESGEVRLWSPSDGAPMRVLGTTSGAFRGFCATDREGWRLAAGDADSSVKVWDVREPADAEPLVVERPEPAYTLTAAFESNGPWLATSNSFAVAFWPLAGPWMRTLRGEKRLSYRLSFSPDGRWLASCPLGGSTRLWPLDPADGLARVVAPAQPCFALIFAPVGPHLLVGTAGGGAFLHDVPEGSTRPLRTGWEGAVSNGTYAVAFDMRRHRAAACPFDMNPAIRDPKLRVLRVWDLESGQGRTFSLAQVTDASWWGFDHIRFAPDGSLYAAGNGGVTHLVLPADPGGMVSSERLYAAGRAGLDLSRDGRQLLVWASRKAGAERYEELLVFDRFAHRSRAITTHGHRLEIAAIDPSGRIVVTGDVDGVVRAGPVTGEEPHLLLGGDTGVIWALAVSPDGRWIASVGDKEIHLWPMPDVTKPPLHTLPHADLLAKLDALTNVHAVRDPSTSTGWKLEIGPFPGWKDVPRW